MNSVSAARSMTAIQPPATCGRPLFALILAALLAGPAAINAAEPPLQSSSPYTDPRQPGQPHYHSPHTRPQQPDPRPGPRTWTGLQLETGISVSLTFGSDPYHDGATLAAILQGLQVGEVLLLERTETGVRLRRHGGRAGSAYDDLDFDPDPAGQQP